MIVKTPWWSIAVTAAFCVLAGLARVSAQASASPAKSPDYSTEPFVIDHTFLKIVFENDGTYAEDATASVHIQSQAGLQDLGVLHFPYASATSSIEIVYVRVIKSDRSVVQTPAESAMDMTSDITRQAPLYSDLKEKQLAVKGLEVGDTLEYEYRTQVKTPLVPGQFWFSYNFTRGAIVLDEELQIGVPRDKYVNLKTPEIKPTVTDQAGVRLYDWKTKNLERKTEDKDADAEEKDRFPSIQLTTFRSWDEVGRWFRSLAGPQAVVTPEIQAKAAELTRDATADSEKIRALYAFVSTNFRYIGISLGIGRYQPHAAAEVLGNGYGDCKDKHTLFAALLSAEGIQAYPALINSTGKIDPDVPSPQQFDHVITAVPQAGAFLFLDTTPEVAPFGFLIEGLRDQQTLVVPENGPAQLVKTPAEPPFKSFFTFQADGTLDDAGTLVSKMQMTFRGDAELAYRLIMRQAGQPQWNDVMQRVSSGLGFSGTVSDVTAGFPEATDVPFQIGYTYNLKEYSDWANRRIVPPFPPFFLPEARDTTDKKPSPVQLGAPAEFLYQATMVLPSGFDPRLPATIDLHESFADYHAEYSFANGAMHFERRLVTKVHQVPAGQIDSYRKFYKAILDDAATFIPLSRDGLIPPVTKEVPIAEALPQPFAAAK